MRVFGEITEWKKIFLDQKIDFFQKWQKLDSFLRG